MPPSASENCRSGNCCSLPEKSRSTVVHIRFDENRVMVTANGASGICICPGMGFMDENENPGTYEPEPKCNDTGMCVSEHTRHRRSQWSEWNDGNPSGTGLSGNHTVRAPLVAARSASAIVASMSQTGRIASGT